MQAIVKDEEAAYNARLTSVKQPEALPHQALIKVHAIGLNRGELTLLKIMQPGWRAGFDLAGEVIEPAADGSGPRKGQRIFAFSEGAAWGEYAAVSTSRMAILPDALSFEVGAAIPMSGITALASIQQLGDIAGKDLLVTAGRGGVGALQVQLALHKGARVTVASSQAEALSQQHTPNLTWVKSLDNLNPKFTHVLDGVGGDTLAKAIKVTAPHSHIVSFGNTANAPTPLSYLDTMGGHEGLTLSFLQVTPNTEDLTHVATLYADGILSLDIETYSWQNIDQALQQLEGRSGKKIVCTL